MAQPTFHGNSIMPSNDGKLITDNFPSLSKLTKITPFLDSKNGYISLFQAQTPAAVCSKSTSATHPANSNKKTTVHSPNVPTDSQDPIYPSSYATPSCNPFAKSSTLHISVKSKSKTKPEKPNLADSKPSGHHVHLGLMEHRK